MDHEEFENASVIGRIDEACDRWPDRACFLFRGEETSYRRVQERSIQVANRVLAAGFEKGMRGAIFSPNDPAAFIAVLGVIRAGGIWLPINPRNSVGDNCALLERFGCDFLFHHSAFAGALDAIKASSRRRLGAVCVDAEDGSDPTMDAWLQGAPTLDPAVPVGPHDIVTTPMTGGTTGLPKAVVERDDDAQLDAEAILRACKDRLGGVKAPKSVDFVDALPKSANGKTLKREIRERYWKGAGRRI